MLAFSFTKKKDRHNADCILARHQNMSLFDVFRNETHSNVFKANGCLRSRLRVRPGGVSDSRTHRIRPHGHFPVWIMACYPKVGHTPV